MSIDLDEFFGFVKVTKILPDTLRYAKDCKSAQHFQQTIFDRLDGIMKGFRAEGTERTRKGYLHLVREICKYMK